LVVLVRWLMYFWAYFRENQMDLVALTMERGQVSTVLIDRGIGPGIFRGKKTKGPLKNVPFFKSSD